MNNRLEELLNDGLEARSTGQLLADFLAHHQEDANELEPLLQVAEQIVSTFEVTPRPEAKAATLYTVLAHAGERPKSNWAWLFPLLAIPRPAALVAAVLLLFVVSSTTTVVASASALPGDPLYPVKTGWEQVQLALTLDEEGKGRAHLEQASQRTAEVSTLNAQGRDVPPDVVQTLAEQTAAATASMDKGAAPQTVSEKLLELTERQQEVLTSVAAKVPEAAKPAIEHALKVSQQGHERAQEALQRAKTQRGEGEGPRHDRPSSQPSPTATVRPRQPTPTATVRPTQQDSRPATASPSSNERGQEPRRNEGGQGAQTGEDKRDTTQSDQKRNENLGDARESSTPAAGLSLGISATSSSSAVKVGVEEGHRQKNEGPQEKGQERKRSRAEAH